MFHKALVVDDNFYNRDLARMALENAEYTVAEAENGMLALQMLQEETYDLLILDLAMPELDGIGVISEIRKRDIARKMKIVVVTAHSHMTGPVEMDADFVMFKPIDIAIFVTFLNRLKQAAATRAET
jgi:CheY-like chemotaxis protein